MLVLALLGRPAAAVAQASQAPASDDEPPRVTMAFHDVTRVESWSFFTPPATTGGDPSYALVGNRARLSGRITGRRLDVFGAFQYAQLLGLPRAAVGPGPLGPGALYHDAARAPNAYQLYFKGFSLRVKELLPGVSLEAGRMGFASGAEAAAGSSALGALRSERLVGRLLGEAEWTAFERAFDGIRVDIERRRWHANGSFILPTQGAFEESANPTMERVRVASGSLTARSTIDRTPRRPAPRDWEVQFFAARYDDERGVRARPDNTGLGASAIDVAINTLGVSHIGLYPVHAGRLDTVLSFVRQSGDWYGDRHSAYTALAEGGLRFDAGWRPWLRLGFSYASGDDDAADATHGTFFPMLPTTRPAALSATFAEMNLRTWFAELRLEPTSRLSLAASLHRLSLAAGTDLWYSGTGATALRGTYFGYSGRGTASATRLGTLLLTSAETPLGRRWTLKASAAVMHGGNAVTALFPGRHLRALVVESGLHF
jgi:hypothetical protein